jgi:hypothetical protein
MLITTLINGEMCETDDSLLEKREGVVDNENENTTWVEYRFKGKDEIVHRSAHVTLKSGIEAKSAVGGF